MIPNHLQLNMPRRLLHDLRAMQQEHDACVEQGLPPLLIFERLYCTNTTYHLIGFLRGADETVYEEVYFKVQIDFLQGYPIQMPEIHFLDNVYNPLVDQSSGKCILFCDEDWSPAWDLPCLFRIIQFELTNVESSLRAMGCWPSDSAMFDLARRFYDSPTEEWKKAAVRCNEYRTPLWSTELHRNYATRKQRKWVPYLTFLGVRLGAKYTSTEQGPFMEIWCCTVMPQLLGYTLNYRGASQMSTSESIS